MLFGSKVFVDVHICVCTSAEPYTNMVNFKDRFFGFCLESSITIQKMSPWKVLVEKVIVEKSAVQYFPRGWVAPAPSF